MQQLWQALSFLQAHLAQPVIQYLAADSINTNKKHDLKLLTTS